MLKELSQQISQYFQNEEYSEIISLYEENKETTLRSILLSESVEKIFDYIEIIRMVAISYLYEEDDVKRYEKMMSNIFLLIQKKQALLEKNGDKEEWMELQKNSLAINCFCSRFSVLIERFEESLMYLEESQRILEIVYDSFPDGDEEKTRYGNLRIDIYTTLSRFKGLYPGDLDKAEEYLFFLQERFVKGKMNTYQEAVLLDTWLDIYKEKNEGEKFINTLEEINNKILEDIDKYNLDIYFNIYFKRLQELLMYKGDNEEICEKNKNIIKMVLDEVDEEIENEILSKVPQLVY